MEKSGYTTDINFRNNTSNILNDWRSKIYELSLYTFAVTAAEVSEMKIRQQLTRHVRTIGLWLCEPVSRILHRFAFPVFSYTFLGKFFHYNTQISTENIYRILL